MTLDSFVVLDLKKDNFGSAVKVLSNETSKKILECISEKEKTESEIAKELSIPLPTVHFHIKKLKSVGLVDFDNIRYSEKGREIRYYKYTDKALVIAPRDADKFLAVLKKISMVLFLPVLILVIYTLGKAYLINPEQTQSFGIVADSQERVGDFPENGIKMVITEIETTNDSTLEDFVCGAGNNTNETNISSCRDLESESRIIVD
ncbi:MAG: ArsR/SmtB family transcription factor [Nanoarchaeota archaeon]